MGQLPSMEEFIGIASDTAPTNSSLDAPSGKSETNGQDRSAARAELIPEPNVAALEGGANASERLTSASGENGGQHKGSLINDPAIEASSTARASAADTLKLCSTSSSVANEESRSAATLASC